MRLTADLLLRCYQRGVFPMAESREDRDLFLVDPEMRGVIPLDDRFHLPKRLTRFMKGSELRFRVDTAFAEVIAACAAPQPGRMETWISPEIERLYTELHERDIAHSVEVWEDQKLVGGLYGVAIGGAFFGESMFSRARDVSKTALAALVHRLRRGGFRLLDAQFWTPHLAQFGTEIIPKREFHRRLAVALKQPGNFRAVAGEISAAQLVQEMTQMS